MTDRKWLELITSLDMIIRPDGYGVYQVDPLDLIEFLKGGGVG